MHGVLSDNAVRIRKCMLRQHEWHTMLTLVFRILARIPLKARVWHAISLLQIAIFIYGVFYGATLLRNEVFRPNLIGVESAAYLN